MNYSLVAIINHTSSYFLLICNNNNFIEYSHYFTDILHIIFPNAEHNKVCISFNNQRIYCSLLPTKEGEKVILRIKGPDLVSINQLKNDILEQVSNFL